MTIYAEFKRHSRALNIEKQKQKLINVVESLKVLIDNSDEGRESCSDYFTVDEPLIGSSMCYEIGVVDQGDHYGSTNLFNY